MIIFFGVLLSFFSTFIMTATKPYTNRNFEIKNLLILSMTGTVSVLFFFQHFVNYENISIYLDKFIFFSEPIFYVTLILNVASQYLGRKSDKNNERNLIFGQFANFVLIAFVPITSYAALHIFDFTNTIDVKYSSFKEMILISSALLLLCFLFFMDKIRGRHVIRIDILLLFVLTSTINFVLLNKLMQMYDTEAVYFCTIFFNSLIWFSMAKKQGEFKKTEKRHVKTFFLFGATYIIYSYVNVLMVNLLPSEHLAILKTISSILAAAFFDFINAKKFTLSKKDVGIIISIMIILSFLSF